MKFAECMRDNGVSEFPDPDASGELTIDGVVEWLVAGPEQPRRSSRPSARARTCSHRGSRAARRSPEQQEARLKFAQCMRDNGVKDFPDPAKDAPLVDTNRIPSANREGGMTILNAAMQKCGDAVGGRAGGRGEAQDVGAGRSGRPGCRDRHRRRGRAVQREQATPAAPEAPANTVKVEQGELSAMVSLHGTLTYRARSDGSPYSAINQARGIYTKLPDEGDKVDCGDVLYRVDDDPVLLLCGTVPAYRDLSYRRRGQGRPSAQPQPALVAPAVRTTFTWQTERRSEAPARQGPCRDRNA